MIRLAFPVLTVVNQFKRFYESVIVTALRRAVFTTWPAATFVLIAWVSLSLYDNETLACFANYSDKDSYVV